MRNLEISLGKVCNNRCVFCATGEQSRNIRGWMDPEEVRRSLRKGREEGAESVGFVGGEPTLLGALPELVRLARELGYVRVALCTNGRRLSSRPLLQSLLEAGLTRVALSVHSHRADLEDHITGVPGAFRQKLSALELLTAARRAGQLPHGLSLNTVLHARNVASLPRLVSFFHRRGCGDMRLNFIRPEVAPDQARRWVPSFGRTTGRIRELLLFNETRLGARITLADFPLCRLPWELLANPRLRRRYLGEPLDLDTRVAMHRPSAKGGTKEFQWREQRVEYLKRHPAVCGRCPLRSVCEGVWRGYLDLFGEGEFEDGPRLARMAR